MTMVSVLVVMVMRLEEVMVVLMTVKGMMVVKMPPVMMPPVMMAVMTVNVRGRTTTTVVRVVRVMGMRW